MKKTIMKGACLARSLETQASDSTGFRYSLKQFIEYLDESKTAYSYGGTMNTYGIIVDSPAENYKDYCTMMSLYEKDFVSLLP